MLAFYIRVWWSNNLLGVWANCTLISRNVFIDIISTIRAKKKHFVSCASLLYPTLPFCDVQNRISTDFQNAFDAFSITHFNLNSPATDTILIACGKTVPRLGSTETLLSSARLHRSMSGLAEGTILPVSPALDLLLARKMAACISSWKTNWNSNDPQ